MFITKKWLEAQFIELRELLSNHLTEVEQSIVRQVVAKVEATDPRFRATAGSGSLAEKTRLARRIEVDGRHMILPVIRRASASRGGSHHKGPTRPHLFGEGTR